jgi:chromosome segregation ATPase
MARAHAIQEEGRARERATLLATTHGEAVEATQRVSTLGDELATVHQARDATEERILGLEAEVSMAHQWREAAEEQWKRLVHKLTLLNIRDSELCITITGAPPLTPLNKLMHFVVA